MDLSTSYRRISVGALVSKMVDKYMTRDTGDITARAQPKTQYGFTAKTSFQLRSILRGMLEIYAESQKVALIFLTSDILNAFTKTCRTSQLYECICAGEYGKYFKYSCKTYEGTVTMIYGDRNFSQIYPRMVRQQTRSLKISSGLSTVLSTVYIALQNNKKAMNLIFF